MKLRSLEKPKRNPGQEVGKWLSKRRAPKQKKNRESKISAFGRVEIGKSLSESRANLRPSLIIQ
jgi:hypothetical protein